MSGGEGPDVIACRVYTHGRRHPIVIGNIQGLRIPPVTPAQLGLAVGSAVVLVVGRAVWAHFGFVGNGLVFLAVPLGLAWAARAVRLEGRAPWRSALGWLQQLSAAPEGMCLGRRDRPMRPARYRGRVWIAELSPLSPPSPGLAAAKGRVR